MFWVRPTRRRSRVEPRTHSRDYICALGTPRRSWAMPTLDKRKEMDGRTDGWSVDHHLSHAQSWWGCWRWTPLQWMCNVDPNMFNGWHVWGVCRPCRCFHLQGIVYRRFRLGAMHYPATRQGNDVCSFTLLFIKMHMCLLSAAFASSYYNPTTTTGNSVLNLDISKQLAHTTLVQRVIKCELLPTQDSYDQVKTPVRTTCTHWASLRRFLTVCVEMFWFLQTDCCQMSGWLI